MLSDVDDTRLMDCTITASALVWCVPARCPAQLGAWYRLLHPHRPILLVVVHQVGVIERGSILIFIPLLDIMEYFGTYYPFTCPGMPLRLVDLSDSSNHILDNC